MTSLLLVVSALLVLGAVGFLIPAVIGLVSELKRTARLGTESAERIREVITVIRDDEGLLRDNLTQLSEATAGWPRVIALPRESLLLVRNIRALGTTAALFTTLRRLSW